MEVKSEITENERLSSCKSQQYGDIRKPRRCAMDNNLYTMQETNEDKKKKNVFTANNVNRKAAWNKYKTSQSLESSAFANLENNPETSSLSQSFELNGVTNLENNQECCSSLSQKQKRKTTTITQNKYVAMDCEMVGVGYKGQDDILARVSIVNKRGDVLLDKFVKPCETVTDYRTSVSGIRPHNIENGEDFYDVQDQVKKLIQGKVLVGHGLSKDLSVLHLKHPYSLIRDTARYKPLCRLVTNGRTPSLKCITHAILGLDIQSGEHNSIEDARAAMKIYNRLSFDWEKHFRKQKNCK
uniref:RNA exonuclease 4 n=1 Tax=Glossina brevipalpis TaxID=37001 RepID=A0A1A9WKL6_9MUSC